VIGVTHSVMKIEAGVTKSAARKWAFNF